MSNTLLIVESKNDQYFIEAYINHLEIACKDIEPISYTCDNFECLSGYTELPKKLIEVSSRIKKDDLNTIGIILDADEEGIEKRITFINSSLHEICDDIEIKEINTLYKSESLDVNFCCYIMNYQGYGELETVLKEIKSEDSYYADCLTTWNECLASKDKEILSKKNFDKLWINFYQRFDCCNNKEKKQAGRKCSFESSMKKDIWNFNSSILSDLKTFFHNFN